MDDTQNNIAEGHDDNPTSSDGCANHKSQGKSFRKEKDAKLSARDGTTKNKKRRERKDEDEETKAKRRAAYRISASKYRKRQKDLVKDLHKTLAFVEKDNSDLRNTNNELKAQLKLALEENQLLKNQHAFSQPHDTASTSFGSQPANQNFLYQQEVASPLPSVSFESIQNFNNLNSVMVADATLPRSIVDTAGTNQFTNMGLYNQISSSMQPNSGQNASQQNLSLQIPNNMSSFGGQLQQQPTSLLGGIGSYSDRIDPSNVPQHFLGEIHSHFTVPRHSSTTDNNAASSFATQTMMQSMNSSSEARNDSADQYGHLRGNPPR